MQRYKEICTPQNFFVKKATPDAENLTSSQNPHLHNQWQWRSLLLSSCSPVKSPLVLLYSCQKSSCSPVLLSKVLLYSCLKSSCTLVLLSKVLLYSCLNPYSRPPRKFRERPSNFREQSREFPVRPAQRPTLLPTAHYEGYIKPYALKSSLSAVNTGEAAIVTGYKLHLAQFQLQKWRRRGEGEEKEFFIKIHILIFYIIYIIYILYI